MTRHKSLTGLPEEKGQGSSPAASASPRTDRNGGTSPSHFRDSGGRLSSTLILHSAAHTIRSVTAGHAGYAAAYAGRTRHRDDR